MKSVVEPLEFPHQNFFFPYVPQVSVRFCMFITHINDLALGFEDDLKPKAKIKIFFLVFFETKSWYIAHPGFQYTMLSSLALNL